jgi:hypothetical protein
MTLSKDDLDAIIENITQATFHMTDEEAKPVIDGFINAFPDLLNHYTREELYKL